MSELALGGEGVPDPKSDLEPGALSKEPNVAYVRNICLP